MYYMEKTCHLILFIYCIFTEWNVCK